MGKTTLRLVAFVMIGSALALAAAQEPTDKQVAEMEGDWEVTYTNTSVRFYSIDKDGVVKFPEEGLKGQIRRKAEALLLGFEGDGKIERLTMGMDGRLFIEHFTEQAGLIEAKATIMGIGIRQK